MAADNLDVIFLQGWKGSLQLKDIVLQEPDSSPIAANLAMFLQITAALSLKEFRATQNEAHIFTAL